MLNFCCENFELDGPPPSPYKLKQVLSELDGPPPSPYKLKQVLSELDGPPSSPCKLKQVLSEENGIGVLHGYQNLCFFFVLLNESHHTYLKLLCVRFVDHHKLHFSYLCIYGRSLWGL